MKHKLPSLLLPALSFSLGHAQCSKGTGAVSCSTDVDDCASETLVGCEEVFCDTGTCDSTIFQESSVTCFMEEGSWRGSCSGAIFQKSYVDLQQLECNECQFVFSAVTVNSLIDFEAYYAPTFGFCSCCDDTSGGNNCPNEVPSCTENLEEFCSQAHLLRTCKEWGNPICQNISVVTTAQPVLIADNTTCSGGFDYRICDESYGINSCVETEVNGCTTICTENSCGTTVQDNSTVGCYGARTCDNSLFRQSMVYLDDEATCSYCELWSTAVTTSVAIDLDVYDAPAFRVCSCCDGIGGDYCPEGVPSCTEDAASFCAANQHGRTCKDWGNPVCSSFDIPSILIVTTANNCSEGVDTLFCEGYSGCSNIVISNCTVICTDDSCDSSTFAYSIVGCYEDSCQDSTFQRSRVSLDTSDGGRSKFFSSAVTINIPLDPTAYDAAAFYVCSCCDGIDGVICPEDVPSCTEDTASFCATNQHERTCKDWGNPVCSNLDIPSIPAIAAASNCSEGVATLFCEGYSGCQRTTISNCTTICTASSCDYSTFKQSIVGCYEDSCADTLFQRSRVSLVNSDGRGSKFLYSAVTTNGPLSTGLYEADFGLCSCCDDTSKNNVGGCPDGISSCTVNTTAFCSEFQLGKSCKDWGNPICVDTEAENTTNATLANLLTFTNASSCSLPENDVVCEGADCSSLTVTGCTLECYGDTCTNSIFNKSAVACLEDDTCDGSAFFNSHVDCALSECGSSNLYSSALKCGSDDSSIYGSCQYLMTSRCTCCDGESCPLSSMGSCNDPDTLCGTTWLGRTCKDWNNPVCEGIPVVSPKPLHPAAVCSLGEDIFICDEGENGCLGLESEQCTVICNGEVCNRASFVDSFVWCQDRPVPLWTYVAAGDACVSASFIRSHAACIYSCVGAVFEESTVECTSSSCTSATFNNCSCCDGDGCPFGVPTCENNMDALCSTRVNGETCACRGLPNCGKEHTSQCTGPIPGSASVGGRMFGQELFSEAKKVFVAKSKSSGSP